MRTRILALVAVLLACLGATLIGLPAQARPARADTLPAEGNNWPMCSSPSDEYCVVVKRRNGADVNPGDTYQPYVDTIGSGTIRYGVYRVVGPNSYGDVDPNDEYILDVRTGTVDPREVFGRIKDVTFNTYGNAVSGYEFALTFKPTPVHHVGYNGDTRTCSVYAGCGDSTWEASLDYDGFVTGYVTDLEGSGLSDAEIGWRTGMVRAYNAQDENTYYDPDIDSLVIKLANPHLTGTGAVATGSYQMYFPNDYLINVMGVPDPSSLTGGSFTVTRSATDSSGPVPFTVTHDSGGVQVSISGITYSRPTYKIKPKPTVPGKPRTTAVVKVSGGAKIYFKAPLANGGRSVDRYSARCRRSSTSSWVSVAGSRSPLTIRPLYGTASCQVRAHNSIGWGSFGSLWTSH
ncbi:MAG: hypothetical protein ACJ72L_04380 [Marmoricola sp.]